MKKTYTIVAALSTTLLASVLARSAEEPDVEAALAAERDGADCTQPPAEPNLKLEVNEDGLRLIALDELVDRLPEEGAALTIEVLLSSGVARPTFHSTTDWFGPSTPGRVRDLPLDVDVLNQSAAAALPVTARLWAFIDDDDGTRLTADFMTVDGRV